MVILGATGVDLTSGPVDAIVQESADAPGTGGTSITGTLPNASPFDSNSRCVMYAHHNTNEGTSWDAGWTELSDGSFTSPDSAAA